MENKQVIYDFCPKCGSLTKNGICVSCGQEAGQEESRDEQHGMTARAAETGEGNRMPPLDRPAARKKGSAVNQRAAVAIVCGGIVLFFVLLFTALFLIFKDIRLPERIKDMPTEQAAAEKEEGTEGYMPDASDPYYVELADAVRTDLFYQVRWKECKVKKGEISFLALYPQLEGEIPHLEDLNVELEEEALFYTNYLEDYAREEEGLISEVESIAYVTYMDEEIISIVFQETIWYGGGSLPGLYDLNIDVQTGTILRHTDILNYSEELAAEFRSRNAIQNGEELSKEEWTDETLKQLLGGGSGILFYTPVGLELGVNYQGNGGIYGWATVTLKEYEKYRKKL